MQYHQASKSLRIQGKYATGVHCSRIRTFVGDGFLDVKQTFRKEGSTHMQDQLLADTYYFVIKHLCSITATEL